VAFPLIAGTSGGSAGGSSFSAVLPSGVQQGDMLIIFVARLLATTTTWPVGWNALVTNTTNDYAFEARYKFAGASEGNPTISYGRAESGQYRVLRITGHEPNVAPAISTVSTGSSNAPNSPVLDPAAWATEDTLWLSVAAVTDINGNTPVPSSYPANYTAGPTVTSDPRFVHAWRNLQAASEDPAAYAMSVTVTWFAATLAIRPMQAHVGTATLAALASLAVGGFADRPAAAVLTQEAELTAGRVILAAAADLAATTNLASVAGLPAAAAHLAQPTSLDAELTYRAHAAVDLSTTAELTSAAVPPTTMAVQSNLITSGLFAPGRAAAVMAATPNLQVLGFGYLPASAALIQESSLGGTLYSLWPGAVELSAGSALIVGAAIPIITRLPGIPLYPSPDLFPGPDLYPGGIEKPATFTVISNLVTSGPFLVTGGTDLVLMPAVATLTANAISFRPPLIVPSGPVRRLLRVPQYRLYAADTRTGRLGWELPFSELSWNNPLNDVGTLRASLVIEDALERIFEQGERDPRMVFREVLTGPYRFSMVLAWGDQVIFAGPYLPSTNPGDQPTVDIGAGELLRMMDKRVLSDPHEVMQLGPTSAGGIIKGIIDKATENRPSNIWWRQGRELPITCGNPPPTTGSVTRIYYGYDTVKAAEALQAYSAEENAPDYRLDPYLVTGADGLYVKWELRIGNPTLGSVTNAWTFDDSNAIVSQDIDAGRMASMWFLPGSGQDEKKLIAWWVNMSAVNRGFPALEDVDSSYTSEASSEVLNTIARSMLGRYRDPVDQWTVKVSADMVPQLGSYRVGDAMLLDVRRHPIIEPGVYSRRITEISGDASPHVSLLSSVKA
jgi:hypothetical protein